MTQEKSAPEMQIRFRFDTYDFIAQMQTSPTTLDLAAMLPLTMDIEDYALNEKIAYLPRKLTAQGASPFQGEAPGDLCYYAPWGNLVFYYDRYRYSSGLIRLGRLIGGIDPLHRRGKFPLAADLII